MTIASLDGSSLKRYDLNQPGAVCILDENVVAAGASGAVQFLDVC